MRGVRVLLVVVSVIVVVVVVWFVLGPLPGWIAGPEADRLGLGERLALVGSVRGQCIQLVSVSGGLATVVYGTRRYFLDREKQRLERDKYVTDRFSAAVGHLGSTDETVRAGGVRTLARIMADSPRDHQWVVDTLVDALRHWSTERADHRGRVPDDVAAAAAALRARPDRDEARLELVEVHLPEVNLRGARLDGADLTEADLKGAILSGARLAGATLPRADLQEADLSNADLGRADLGSADLRHAILTGANLTGADLSRARLSGTALARCRFEGAELTGADLRGADLREAVGLTAEAVRKAITDHHTEVPDGMAHPRRTA
jgi:pentapeptide repeat protein